MPAAEKEQVKQRIRVKIKAYDYKIIDKCTKQIVETALKTGALIVGPVPLPTEKSKYCVIRSPHIHKDSRDQFEIRIHKRLIDILEPTSKTIDSLMNLNLPTGVDIEIKM